MKKETYLCVCVCVCILSDTSIPAECLGVYVCCVCCKFKFFDDRDDVLNKANVRICVRAGWIVSMQLKLIELTAKPLLSIH